MNVDNYDKAQGHWILARMGKRVLRPGGKELTKKMIKSLDIKSGDEVVEFAPGLGFTASLVLECCPCNYVGVDADKDAIQHLRGKVKGPNCTFIMGNANQTDLEDNSKDKVFGEAMLTMHADHKKSEIIKEANRILKKGGYYAIHEIGLSPDNMGDTKKAEIQKELAQTIRVNARPLTETEWKSLLESEGFRVVKIITNPMHLLKNKRMIDDEGFWRYLKINYNILTHPKARRRIISMRNVFNKYENNMNAISIIAEKL